MGLSWEASGFLLVKHACIVSLYIWVVQEPSSPSLGTDLQIPYYCLPSSLALSDSGPQELVLIAWLSLLFPLL